jgi:hypothetical protein
MKRATELGSFMLFAFRKFAQLGARTLFGCATALIAAVLIFSAPEVGIIGACGGIVLGGISAALIRPHLVATPKSSVRSQV